MYDLCVSACISLYTCVLQKGTAYENRHAGGEVGWGRIWGPLRSSPKFKRPRAYSSGVQKPQLGATIA